jgi:PEP-CTERM motif
MKNKMLALCFLFALTFVLTSLPREGNAIPLVPNRNTDLSLFTFPGHGFGVTDGFPGRGNGVTGGFTGPGNGVSSTQAPEPTSLVLLASGLVGLIGVRRTKRRIY